MPQHQQHQRLQEISALCTEEGIFHKLDIVASIYVQGRHVLNVYRRYNSTFNIVFEDGRDGLHFQTNKSLIESIEELFQTELDTYPDIERLYSFKHQAYMTRVHYSSLWRMTWEYIATYYGCILLKLGDDLAAFELPYFTDASSDSSSDSEEADSDSEEADDHLVLRSGRRVVRLSQE